MMFDREHRELRQDQNPDPLADFDLSLIDLIPSERDQEGLKEMHRQEAAELRSGKLKQRMSEVLGKEIALGEINRLFQFPERGIESQTLMSTGEHSNYLETETILYTRKNGEAQLAGRTNLAFIKGADPILLIRYRDLEKTGEQLGIEIQCRLEKFCRDNGIWEILNVARSQPANYFGRGNRSEIGAYVWARCGFEFNSGAEALGVMYKYIEYKVKHGIEPLNDFAGFGRPIDYAKLTGKDRQGNIVPLGKDFLTKTSVVWEGKRDLRLDSRGTKDFMDYLQEKGRTDLIEKYLTA